MGWDAFGLPAENAAKQNGVHRATWTYQNIANMRDQLKIDGAVARLDPRVRHLRCRILRPAAAAVPRHAGQRAWLSRRKSKVNWDPVDETVLANEQVIDGRGWRSGALVEQRELDQWFFKISDYAEDLLAALDDADRWPEKVRIMQRNWIGRSEGLRVLFEIAAERQDGRARSRSSPRAPTRSTARPSWRCRPTIR